MTLSPVQACSVTAGNAAPPMSCLCQELARPPITACSEGCTLRISAVSKIEISFNQTVVITFKDQQRFLSLTFVDTNQSNTVLIPESQSVITQRKVMRPIDGGGTMIDIGRNIRQSSHCLRFRIKQDRLKIVDG